MRADWIGPEPRRPVSLEQFVREHRREIDAAIRFGSRQPPETIDDDERELWLLQDQALYSWARSLGARI